MLKKISFFLSIFLLLIPSQIVFGQYFSNGNDPARVRWRQIKTDNYYLIYPRETDSLARIYLKYLEAQRGPVYEPLEITPRRIPVILHPYTTVSNGMVTWAPKRVELITTPDPYDGSADYWIKHLTLHEMRHVGQVEHYTKGIYNVFYYLLGEQVTGLGLGLFVSKFMLEGDAVMSETELSKSGRGRSADFFKLLRAQYLNGDFKNYDRYFFGSYRYNTPDIYVLGYTVGSYARYETEQYHLSGKMFASPVKHWYDIRAMISPLTLPAGADHFEYFKRSQQMYSRMWKEDLFKRGTLTKGEPLVTGKRFLCPEYPPAGGIPVLKYKSRENLYAEYRNGIYINASGSPYDKCLIAVKTGMLHSPELICIDSSGRERFIRHFNGISSKLVYDGWRRIYWSETISRGPSELEDFSVVKYFDIYDKTTGSIGRKTKYFNPVPLPDGETLAVVEYPVKGSSFLTFISFIDGSVKARYETPDKGNLKEIVCADGTIYCTVVRSDGLSIMSFRNGEWNEVSRKQHQSISGLRNDKNSLYFTSDLDGVLNIYRYFPSADSLVRITNSKYGANFPYIDTLTNTLYYSEFDEKGYYCVKNSLPDLQNVHKSFSEPYKYPFAEVISGQVKDSCFSMPLKETLDTINTFDREKYPSRKYNKFLHAFRFHSWLPLYVDIDKAKSLSLEDIRTTVNLGVTLMSQNSLGTVVTMASYGYVNGFHKGLLRIDASIWGNVRAELKFDINSRERQIYKFDYSKKVLNYANVSGSPLLQTNLLLYYPLRFNSGGWYRTLSPQFAWSFTNDQFFAYSKKKFINKHELKYGISYGQVLSKGKSQIFPRWGFGLSLFGTSAPGTGENFGNLLYLYGYLYLPGIFRTNGIKLTAAFQQQFANNKLYYLGSYSSMPRGYGNDFHPMTRYFMATLDYALPVYLGDISVGSLLYLQRMQFIPFIDYAIDINKSNRTTSHYYSAGADMLVDFYVLKLSFPLSVGVRYAKTGRQAGKSSDTFQVLFNVSF